MPGTAITTIQMLVPGDAMVVERAVALIKELDMVERVLVSSFNHSYLTRVKAANPALPTAAIAGAAATHTRGP